jgi:hypothetical protein
MVGFAVLFGPRTLRRTWGTRPVPTGFFYAIRSVANAAANLLAGICDRLDLAGQFRKIVDAG